MKRSSLCTTAMVCAAIALISSCQNPFNTPDVGDDEASSRVAIGTSTKIEAEAYSAMNGVQLETCSEGGQNVGYLDAGDWMIYPITISTAGTYTVSFRVATPENGKSFTTDLAAGATVLGSVAVPSTGGWQNWQTVTQTVSLPAGTYNFGINAGTGGFNLNWIQFDQVGQSSGTKVEAESFSVMNGVITEPCSEGTLNVGSIDAGDWMVYPLSIPSAGTYTLSFRVSSIHSGRSLSIDLAAGATLLGTVAIPNTGNWQSWQTVTKTVSLPAGAVSLGINGGTGGFNINWFSFQKSGGTVDPVDPVTSKHGKNLSWRDEFSTPGAPDSSKWDYDLGAGGWGNNELQNYTSSASNVQVANGVLTIRAIKDAGGSWTSSRIVTRNKGDWTYGYFEMRAKLPSGRGTWPAFWMLPTDRAYGGWPKSGEIDIMEHVGYDPDVVHTTIHTEAYNHMIGTQKAKQTRVNGSMTGFHNYGVLWNAGSMTWYIDDVAVFTINKAANDGWSQWPFDKRFHLILNLAMGGNWGGAMGMDPALNSASFEIDWVRVYQ